MKIALINVRYSPNLGDGLLAECLEAELSRQLPDASFVALDLAGRTGYGAGSRWRRPVMTMLMLVPGPIRHVLTRLALRRLVKRLSPGFVQTLAECDAAVLGGGNLLADADLNFPIKIAGVLDAAIVARPGGLPTAVYAVGASHNWSKEGASLFRRVLTRPSITSLSVRDELSRQALLAQAPDLSGKGVTLVHDPGLLACRHYSSEPRRADAPIGLCITDPLALRYHGGEAGANEVRDWFGDLLAALTKAGRNVLLFTNGSPEDRAFLTQNTARWQTIDPARIAVAEAAGTPAELVRTIAGCSLIIAHRMHACVVAHSLGIPTIGLRWDRKLDAFFETISRSDYVYTAGSTPAAEVAASAEKALAEGVDPDLHAAVIARAVEHVAHLANHLRDAAAR